LSDEPFVAFCRRLPHVMEDMKSGNDRAFSIGGKMFAVFDQAGAGRIAFKTTPEMFASLTSRPGIRPAPSAARYHWVTLENPQVLPATEIEELIRESYHLVALSLPARIRRELSSEKP